MTTADIIKHWRKGARNALDAAKLLEKNHKHDLALFHCHLAVEKALKAGIMEVTKKPHPKIHRLLSLATMLKKNWSTEEQELLDTLSDFAVAARYDDPTWAEKFATAQNAKKWIQKTENFLRSVLP